ncbi:MAG: ankyrin repeat domain-containing protein [Zoogloeaceae bacterium]|nr:ankyrin repeat domain-containing protein [Zoogloeaceae bacterium]
MLIKTLAARHAARALLLLALAGPAWADTYDDALSAAALGHDGDLAALLKRGLDPETVDASGNTLLILAARDGHLSTVDLLLGYRAKVAARNAAGDSALMMAVLKGNKPVVSRLLDAGAPFNHGGWTPLMYAAFEGQADLVSLLLARGAEVDARAPNQATPLMLAARNGHLDAVRLLLKAGADPTVRNDQGFTADAWAAANGNTDAADLVKAARAGR